MRDHIEWIEERFSDVGMVGGFRFFSIVWGSKRQDPKPWKLSTDLPLRPGASGADGFTDKDSAKSYAEGMMRAYLKAIGAQWIED